MSALKKVSLDEITPDKYNANMGTERGKASLDTSLQRYGAGRSILLDRNNKIIAGNQTFASAGELGFEDVIVVESDGKSLIAVKRTDMDLDDKDGREMAYADNKVGSDNLNWDVSRLEEDFRSGELDLSPFFTEEEIINFSEEKAEDVWEDEEEPMLNQDQALRLRVECTTMEEKMDLAGRLEGEGYRVLL